VEDLLGDAPDLLERLTNANLASTLSRSRDMLGPHRMFAREALRRLTGNQELSNQLFVAYVKALEKLSRERFWECFDLGVIYRGGAGREWIDVGFLMHAVSEESLQPILDMIVRNHPPPESQVCHVVHLCNEQGAGSSYARHAEELEMHAWKDQCAWVKVDRIVANMTWAQADDLVGCLDEIAGAGVYDALKAWYLKKRPSLAGRGAGKGETDLLLWLYDASGDGVPADRALWLERLTEIGLAGNPHLLFWLWGKRPEMPVALRERVERHLDDQTVQSVTGELAEQLAGLKVFVTGYHRKPPVLERLEEIDTVEWTCREVKRDTKFKKGEIKKGCDCAIVFKWISHPCRETVTSVIPRQLFVDGIPPVRIFEFLKEVAAEKAGRRARQLEEDAAALADEG